MSHFWHKPLNLAASSLVIFGMVGLGAFGATAASAHTASHPAAKTGEVIFSNWQWPDGGLNPLQISAVVQVQLASLNNPFGITPYYLPNSHGPNQGVAPGFLTRYPSQGNGGISKNGKTIYIQVRRGLKWSNHTAITAKDMYFGWRVEQDPSTGPACLGSCDHIASMSFSNRKPYNLTFHLKTAYSNVDAIFPIFLPYGWTKLGSPGTQRKCLSSGACTSIGNLLEDPTFNYEDSSYVVAGPWTVTSWSKDDKVTFAPVSTYNKNMPGGKPNINPFIFECFYNNKAGMIAAARSGSVDNTDDYVLQDLSGLHNTSKLHVQIKAAGNPELLVYNVLDTHPSIDGGGPSNISNPLANGTHSSRALKVRLALNMALDRVGLVQSAQSIKSYKKAASFVTYAAPMPYAPSYKSFASLKETGAWDPLRLKYVTWNTQCTNRKHQKSRCAITDAKALLKQAGYGSGFTIYVSTTPSPFRTTGEFGVIHNSWAKIGVTAKLVTPDQLFAGWANPAGTLIHGNFEVGLHAYSSSSPDPDTWYGNITGDHIARTEKIPAGGTPSPLDANEGGINDHVVNHYMRLGAETFNNKTRLRDYQKVELEFAHKAYWSELYLRPNIDTIDNRVKNVSANPFGDAATWNAWDWKAQ